MLSYFRNNRFAAFNLLFDVITISYVFSFNINPARIIGFYWLDTCMMIVFFMFYMKQAGNLDWYAEVIIASVVLLLINATFLPFIIGIAVFAGFPIEMEDSLKLFEPYFDVGIFLLMSFLAQRDFFYRIRALAIQEENMRYILYMNCFLTMFMIPVVTLLSIFVSAFIGNFSLAIMISFLIVRNSIDIWRVKNLGKKERHLLGEKI